MKYLKYKTYLSMVDKCENLELFRNFFAQKDNKEIVDLLEDGENSCASFVSNILYVNGLIKSPHATVDSTEKDLLDFGWTEFSDVTKLEKGDLIIWIKDENYPRRHIGLYCEENKAIHNSNKEKKTIKSDINYRKIEKLLKYTKKDE